MHIEKLEYLVELAKTGSISIASKNLHVSPSGISQSISKLEKELGVQIFKRSRNGAEVTDEGKRIIGKAYEVLIKLQEFKEEAQSHTSTLTGDLKISTIPGILPLISTLSIYKNKYPSVNIEITESPTQSVIHDVVNHKTDIGIIPIYSDLVDSRDDIKYEILFNGIIKVLVNKNSPLAFNKTITAQDLQNQTLVLYNGELIKWFTHHYAEKFGPMKILLLSNSLDLIVKAVKDDLAIALTTDFPWRQNPYVLTGEGEIVSIEIINYEYTHVSYGWIHSTKKPLSLNAKKFIQYFKTNI
ncbi:DNA-binding transcriptional regulator, LysR family [Peribacillus simplex]|uniref:DNA-binding transcriptional regulator, LysR family n=1 Tax=Peribacillus simplex TaxID=1478 RepID=A0A9X8RDM4_9BACI|nr:LysR family transcriptional regulator [Peribacillus simplex]SIS01583.1 DNA-binding transcriptional regulator, LysR family [Peribacillus simplex]